MKLTPEGGMSDVGAILNRLPRYLSRLAWGQKAEKVNRLAPAFTEGLILQP